MRSFFRNGRTYAMKRRGKGLPFRSGERAGKLWRLEDGESEADLWIPPNPRRERRARSPPTGFLRRIARRTDEPLEGVVNTLPVERVEGAPLARVTGTELAPYAGLAQAPAPKELPVVEEARADKEDLPRRPRHTRVPRWYSWKIFVSNYVSTYFNPHPPSGINLNPIVKGEGQDNRIGNLVVMKRLEFRFHVRCNVTQQTTQAPYNIAGNGEVNPLDPDGPYIQTNGWKVPDSGPAVSTLYPPDPGAGTVGFCVTRGGGGRNVSTINAEGAAPLANEVGVYLEQGALTLPATPGIGTIPAGQITPAVVSTPQGYAGNVATPTANINFTQTIPETPRAAAYWANDWQTYGPRGYTVPPIKGAAVTEVPPAHFNSSSSSGYRMQPFRVLIVYLNNSPSPIEAPSIDFFLTPTQPGNYFCGRYNYDNLRGSFEVIADHTINPGDVCEYTLVEEGIKMDHEVVFLSGATAHATTGQLLAFLLCPGDAEQLPNPGQPPELAYGQISVFYSDA